MTPQQLQGRLNALAEEVANPPDLAHDVVLLIEGNVQPHVPVRSGNLLRSLTTVVESPSRARVTTSVEYAQHVHRVRPFFEEGLEASEGSIPGLLEDAGNKMLAKVGGS